MLLTGTQVIFALLSDRTLDDKFGSIARSETAQSKQTPGGKLLHSRSTRIVQFQQFGCEASLGWRGRHKSDKLSENSKAEVPHKCIQTKPKES